MAAAASVVARFLGLAKGKPAAREVLASLVGCASPATASLDVLVGERFAEYIARDPNRAVAATSTVPGAGMGLFASRRIDAGELIAMYPGILYPAPPGLTVDGPPGHSYLLGTHLECQPNPSYALRLEDGAVVDATPGCLEKCCLLRRRVPRCNAIAHMANHPPVGVSANAFCLDMGAFPEAPPLAKRDAAHVPTVPSAWSHVDPFGEAVPLEPHDPRRAPRAVALAASVTIEAGEEVFLDYGLSPSELRKIGVEQ